MDSTKSTSQRYKLTFDDYGNIFINTLSGTTGGIVLGLIFGNIGGLIGGIFGTYFCASSLYGRHCAKTQ